MNSSENSTIHSTPNSNTSAVKRFRYSTKGWLAKSSAGLILGFSLCLGLTGLLLRYGFGEVSTFSAHGQFLMWLMSPGWLLVASLSFLFRSGLKAWLYLGAANLLIWAVVLASPLLRP